MTDPQHNLATRLAEVRSLSNLSQKELADKMAVSPSLISHWEKGSRIPSSAQLLELARQLGVALDYLLNAEVRPHFEFRAKATRHEQSPDVERAMLDAAMQIHFVNAALRLAEKTPRPFSLLAEFTSVPDLPNLAGQVREALKLNRRVTLDEFKQALSERNVFVFEWNMPWNLSGLSFRGPFTVIFINRLHPASRRLFTLAHEFAHVLFHLGRETCDPEEGGAPAAPARRDTTVSIASNQTPWEKQANAFAAEFLMPTADVEKVVLANRGRLKDAIALDAVAREFNVSRDAIFYRLVQHHVFRWQEKSTYFTGTFQPPKPPAHRIDDHEELDKQVDGAFLQLALALLNNHKISTGKLAQWFFAPPHVVNDYLGQLDADIDIAISSDNGGNDHPPPSG